jgi:hypothetical protein
MVLIRYAHQFMHKYLAIDLAHDSADSRHDKEWNYFLCVLWAVVLIYLYKENV